MAGTLDEKLYYDGSCSREAMLQLHDEHTLWKVDNELLEDDEAYWFIVDEVLGQFEGETGVPVSLCGRSGRHVCVEDTPMNRLNYHRLRKVALEYEAECVARANAWRPDGEDE